MAGFFLIFLGSLCCTSYHGSLEVLPTMFPLLLQQHSEGPLGASQIKRNNKNKGLEGDPALDRTLNLVWTLAENFQDQRQRSEVFTCLPGEQGDVRLLRRPMYFYQTSTRGTQRAAGLRPYRCSQYEFSLVCTLGMDWVWGCGRSCAVTSGKGAWCFTNGAVYDKALGDSCPLGKDLWKDTANPCADARRHRCFRPSWLSLCLFLR